jgi:hypothetical protein
VVMNNLESGVLKALIAFPFVQSLNMLWNCHGGAGGRQPAQRALTRE